MSLMNVTVRTMMGEEWIFEVMDFFTVFNLKALIFLEKGMHPDLQVRGRR